MATLLDNDDLILVAPELDGDEEVDPSIRRAAASAPAPAPAPAPSSFVPDVPQSPLAAVQNIVQAFVPKPATSAEPVLVAPELGPPSAPTPAPMPASVPAAAPSSVAPGPVDRSSREAFIRSIRPYAEEAQRRTGIPADIMIAINLNEQGWQHEAPGGNLFGIKGSNPRTGANTGPVATWEDYGQGRVNIQDTFRAYDSPAESYEDFGNFLWDNARYANALKVLKETGDGAAFLREVHRAGYATDPLWSDKVLRIANDVRNVVNGPNAPPPTPYPQRAPMTTLAEEMAAGQAEGLVPTPETAPVQLPDRLRGALERTGQQYGKVFEALTSPFSPENPDNQANRLALGAMLGGLLFPALWPAAGAGAAVMGGAFGGSLLGSNERGAFIPPDVSMHPGGMESFFNAIPMTQPGQVAVRGIGPKLALAADAVSNVLGGPSVTAFDDLVRPYLQGARLAAEGAEPAMKAATRFGEQLAGIDPANPTGPRRSVTLGMTAGAPPPASVPDRGMPPGGNKLPPVGDFKPGDQVRSPQIDAGRPLTVVDASDRAALTVRTEGGRELKIGRRAVEPVAPETSPDDTARVVPEVTNKQEQIPGGDVTADVPPVDTPPRTSRWVTPPRPPAGPPSLPLRGTEPPPPAGPPAGAVSGVAPENPELERGFSETLRESERSSPALRQKLTDTPLTYEGPRSTQGLSDAAKARMDADPIGSETRLLSKGSNYNDADVAEAQHVIRRLTAEGADEKEFARGIDLAEKVAADLTEHGRTIQAASIWNQLDEAGALVRLTRQAKRSREAVGDKRAGKQIGDVTERVVTRKAREEVGRITKNVKEWTEAAGTATKRATGKASRQVDDLIKRTRQGLAYVGDRGRLPRQIAPEQSQERRILNELRRVYDRLGEVIPEDLATRLNDVLDTIKGMDVDDPARLKEAQRLIREDIGQGILGPLKEMEATAKESAALIKKAEQSVTELADLGRNPKLLGLTDEMVQKLNQMRRNANRAGYILSPERRKELAGWLDAIKGYREGSTEKVEAIREYITRLTTGDIAQEIAERTQQFAAARRDIGRVERMTAFLGDLGRSPGNLGLQDEDAAAFAKVRRLANNLGYIMPEVERTGILDLADELRALPEGPEKAAKAQSLVQAVKQELLPELEARWLVMQDEAAQARWEEANLRYLIDEAERITRPRVLSDVQETMQRIRTDLRDGKMDVPVELAESIMDRFRLARSLPEDSPQRYRLLQGAAQDISDLMPPSAWDRVAKVYNLPRQLMAGLYDFSALMRQGRYGLMSHPTAWLRSVKPMLQAFAAPETAARIDAELHTRPTAKFWENAGAYLAPRAGEGTLTTREEHFLGRALGAADRNGLMRFIGSAAWEDAYVTFLNKLRANILDSIYYKYEKRGQPLAPEEAQQYAQWVNWMTGRGSLPPQLDRAAGILAHTFFSPRNMASRVERPVAAGRAAYSVVLGPNAPGAYASRRIAAEIGKDFAAYYSIGAILMGLATAAGYQVGTDPLKSDFGNVTDDDGVRHNIWSDDATLARTLARFLTEQERTASGNPYPIDRGEVVLRYMLGQLSPQTGMALNQIRGKDALGRSIEGPARENTAFGDLDAMLRGTGLAEGSPLRDMAGPVGGRFSDILEHMVPGVLASFANAYGNDRGLGGAARAATGTFLGVGGSSEASTDELRGRLARARFGVDYDAADEAGVPLLDSTQKLQINQSPEVREVTSGGRSLDQREAIGAAARAGQARLIKQMDLDKRLLSGAIDYKQWRLERKTINNEYAGAIENSRVKELPPREVDPNNRAQVLAAQYAAIPMNTDPVTGEEDFKTFFNERDRFMQSLSPEDRNIMERYLDANDTMIERVYRRDMEKIRTYWDYLDGLEASPQVAPIIQRREDAKRAGQELQARLYDRMVNRLMDPRKLMWRRQHPDVDKLMKKWGYVTVLATQRAS
ncbi:MAG: glucosaminidase domain-containing protein [Anaerolineales bacterium]|nr:glucosaminidase domain-containing protein [Anaerolineales bacterium]